MRRRGEGKGKRKWEPDGVGKSGANFTPHWHPGSEKVYKRLDRMSLARRIWKVEQTWGASKQ